MPKRARRRAVSNANSVLKSKILVSWKNFIAFLVLFMISFVIYHFSDTGSFSDILFGVLSIIFGFLSLALLIVLAVFLILKSAKK